MDEAFSGGEIERRQ